MNIKTFRFSVFKKASLCRHFENEVFKKIKEKKITFPVYLSAGQEYVPASISNIVLNKGYKPLLFGQHRAHSIYLSFGGNVNDLIDELLGKKTGCTFGMGGSLSIHSRKINMFGHDGFMGSNASIGVGACFSSKKPTIIFIGDAALEEDYVLASLSWIAKKKLPILKRLSCSLSGEITGSNKNKVLESTDPPKTNASPSDFHTNFAFFHEPFPDLIFLFF